jgi:hypothetical protein
MTFRSLVIIGASLGFASFASSAFAADPVEPNDGVEVLARGPVHEGYAAAVEPKPAASPFIAKQPPEPIEELPPDQKPEGDNVLWLPGYWSWDQEREDFIWISGFWRVPPPNRFWVAGSWRKMDGGWQWSGGFWKTTQAQQAEIEYLPEPPASLDEGPATPAAAETSIYVPGCWVWRTRYVWRPGFWIDHQPGWIWIPSHYRWTPAGYIYVDGYWDYPLADRGLLFAPVYIPRRVYVAPSYCWRPTIVVRDECMYGALFVRRGWGCYYFGDYFDPGYATLGYTSWCGYRGGRTTVVVRDWYDPMFSYYRVSYRNDPYWRGGINDLYAGRFRGEIAAPPRTLVQQNTLIRSTTVINNNIVVNNRPTPVNNVAMLSTMGNVAQSRNKKLQTLSTEARQEQVRTTQRLQEVGRQRTQQENQLLTKNPSTPRATESVRSVKLDVPAAPKLTTVNPQPIRAESANPPIRSSTTNPVPSQSPGALSPPKNVNPQAAPRVEKNVQPLVQPKTDAKAIAIPKRQDPPTLTPQVQSLPNTSAPSAPRVESKPTVKAVQPQTQVQPNPKPVGSIPTPERAEPKSVAAPPRIDSKPVVVKPAPVSRVPAVSRTPAAPATAPASPRVSAPNNPPKAVAPANAPKSDKKSKDKG